MNCYLTSERFYIGTLCDNSSFLISTFVILSLLFFSCALHKDIHEFSYMHNFVSAWSDIIFLSEWEFLFFLFCRRRKLLALKWMRLHDLVPLSSETLSQCMAWASVWLLTLPRFIVGRRWNFYSLKRNVSTPCTPLSSCSSSSTVKKVLARLAVREKQTLREENLKINIGKYRFLILLQNFILFEGWYNLRHYRQSSSISKFLK